MDVCVCVAEGFVDTSEKMCAIIQANLARGIHWESAKSSPQHPQSLAPSHIHAAPSLTHSPSTTSTHPPTMQGMGDTLGLWKQEAPPPSPPNPLNRFRERPEPPKEDDTDYNTCVKGRMGMMY